MCWIRICLAMLACGLATAATASPSSIGVFSTPDGSDCDLTAGPFEVFRTYVCVVLGTDGAAAGITGADFRLVGIDSQWSNTVIPNPAANFALGNPIAGGCTIAFPSCQLGAGTFDVVPLYTIESLASAPIAARRLSVRRNEYCNAFFCCAFVYLCDVPVFTRLCVGEGEALLNDGPCSVAAEPTTWAAVKRLYGQ